MGPCFRRGAEWRRARGKKAGLQEEGRDAGMPEATAHDKR